MKKKKLLFPLVLLVLLTVFAAGCEKRGSAETDLPPQEEEAPQVPAETPEEPAAAAADIRYPQFVTEAFAADPLYQEAAQDEEAVISLDRTIITSDRAVETFWQRYQAGEAAELHLYNFFSQWEPQKRSLIYSGQGGDFTQLVQGAENGAWAEGHRYPVEEIARTDWGCLQVTGEEGHAIDYIQVRSDYDLFPNYEEYQALEERYVTPIYMNMVWSEPFENPKEIVHWLEILTNIVHMDCDGEENFWTRYPGGIISVDEALSWINRYFDVEREDVVSTLRHFAPAGTLLDENTIQYEGGLGGAYPQVLVLDYEEEGDKASLLCRLRDVVTGDVNMEEGYRITIQKLPDGGFHYLSMERVK